MHIQEIFEEFEPCFWPVSIDFFNSPELKTRFSESIQQTCKKDSFLAQEGWLGGKVSDRNSYTVCKGFGTLSEQQSPNLP